MKKILLILIIFFSLLIINNKQLKANSIENNFLNEIKENYQDYHILVNEENVYGHIILVLGSNYNKEEELELSLSICHILKENVDYPLQVKIKSKREKTYTFNQKSMLKTYYKLPIDYSKEYTISIVDLDTFDHLKTYQIGQYNNIDEYYNLSNIIKGEGKNNFSYTNEWKTNVKTKEQLQLMIKLIILLVIYLMISFGSLIVFIIVSVKIYKYRHRKYIYTLDEILKLPREKLYGKTICFATDTVFGIGALFDDFTGKKKIFKLKNRSVNKQLPVLASSIDMVLKHVISPSEEVYSLMEKYWPGALTIIFNNKKGNGTIAFRVPDNIYTRQLIDHFGPLATTSVNISGEKPLNSVEEIDKAFGYKIDYIIKFPEDLPSSNLSSTIIKIEFNEILVLRQGSVYINNHEENDV